MNTNKLFAAVIALQGLTLASMWLGQPTMVAPAQAQLPDAGSQRAAILEEMRGLRAEMKAAGAEMKAQSGKLDKISSFLESGKLQVHIVLPDDTKGRSGR